MTTETQIINGDFFGTPKEQLKAFEAYFIRTTSVERALKNEGFFAGIVESISTMNFTSKDWLTRKINTRNSWEDYVFLKSVIQTEHASVVLGMARTMQFYVSNMMRLIEDAFKNEISLSLVIEIYKIYRNHRVNAQTYFIPDLFENAHQYFDPDNREHVALIWELLNDHLVGQGNPIRSPLGNLFPPSQNEIEQAEVEKRVGAFLSQLSQFQQQKLALGIYKTTPYLYGTNWFVDDSFVVGLLSKLGKEPVDDEGNTVLHFIVKNFLEIATQLSFKNALETFREFQLRVLEKATHIEEFYEAAIVSNVKKEIPIGLLRAYVNENKDNPNMNQHNDLLAKFDEVASKRQFHP